MKKLISLFLVLIMGVGMGISVCAAEQTTVDSEKLVSGAQVTTDEVTGVIISQREEWVSPLEHVTIVERDLGDGFTITETTTDTYSLLRASGTKEQTKTVAVRNGGVAFSTITVYGKFSYNGSAATVVSKSQTYMGMPSGYTMAEFTKTSASGTTAHVSVKYKITKVQGGTVIGSGTASVTCGKDG